MSCSACSNRVEKYLNKQDGVSASVNLVMAQALIEYDENKVSLKDLDRFVEESGYKSLGVYDEKTQEKHKVIKKHSKEKHTVGLEPTISCSVGKRLIQLGYACLLFPKIDIL